MQRTLHPELLDSLTPGDPAADRNRRDLHRLNHLLGNYRWFGRTLPPRVRPGEAILDLGAGTGELGSTLAAAGLACDGLDVWPRPASWAPRQQWYQQDLRSFAGFGRYGAVIGNLILHQFNDGELADLGRQFSGGPRLLQFCEPARLRRSLVLSRLLFPLLGANYVTLQDSRTSIAAGFLGAELPAALGLDPALWAWIHRISPLGLYRFTAWRR